MVQCHSMGKGGMVNVLSNLISGINDHSNCLDERKSEDGINHDVGSGCH